MNQTLWPLLSNLDFVEEQYARFVADPAAVDASWRSLFASGALQRLVTPAGEGEAPGTGAEPAHFFDAVRGAAAAALANAYRVRGHLEARLDPLDAVRREPHPDLDPRTYGFGDADLDRTLPAGVVGPTPLLLRHLLERLRATYCGAVGVEFMHIAAPERRRWLQERMEPSLNQTPVPRETQLATLDALVAATELERFIQAKYVGTKRFSLEGGETLIPMIDALLERAGAVGIEEVVFGMAHRGRLSVLVNTMGLSASQLFAEFEDFAPEIAMGTGDVKYHLGASTDHTTRGNARLHLSLAFNPSHLEAVDPIVVGRVRAKMRRHKDWNHHKVLGVLIHGDAAFAGQGLVAETLNLSDLHGYRTGGTVHIIVNNQIGFTTSPTDARSTPYCTDIAKFIQVPIFHVNGDEPDAVLHVLGLAMEYRRAFATDVVIDMFCFRRHGHNEIDEPSFTQPLLYDRIRRHPAVYELYADRLVAAGLLRRADLDERVKSYHARLEADLAQARSSSKRPEINSMGGVWSGYRGGVESATPDVETAVPREQLLTVGERISQVPAGFHPHSKIARLMEARAAMGRGEKPLDWAMGEALAFGTLLWDGVLVRMSGQDSRRGTFSQRHAVIVDVTNGAEYAPLRHLRDGQGEMRVYDSCLSEAAVLGFEFGYSLDYPDGLVVWEAQFGDFANGAQVIIDQFVSASEDRWKRLSGLVMLLPHGYEGQGPEHSSARLERFLGLCAEDNIQVVYPTTPAQYFHVLRRQVLRKWRKPLVVLTPKSMLRLAAASSPLEDLVSGGFARVLDDPAPPERVERVMLCSGKLYYDLLEDRQRRGDARTALVRLEQLYPLAEAQLGRVVSGYPAARELVWVQEEPSNMGALRFLEPTLRRMAERRSLRLVARAESASPATGSHKAHLLEQKALLEEAFH